MSLLNRVNWTAVYDRLAATISPADEAAVQWRVQHRLPLLDARHMRLAAAATGLGDRLGDLTALRGPAVDWLAVDWLARAAPVAFAAVDYTPARIRLPHTPPCALVTCPGVEAYEPLPLRALADRWAAAHHRPVIVAVVEDLAPGAAGDIRWHETVDVDQAAAVDAAVIRLAPRPVIAWVRENFRHELGHLLDEDPAKTEHHADHHQLHDRSPLPPADPGARRITAARAQLLAEFAALPLGEDA